MDNVPFFYRFFKRRASLSPVRTHQACVFLEDELLEHLFNGEGDNALLQLQVDLAHLLVPPVHQVVEAVDEVHHLELNTSKDIKLDNDRSDLSQVQSLCLLEMLARAQHLFLEVLSHACIFVTQGFVIILVELKSQIQYRGHSCFMRNLSFSELCFSLF